MDSLALVLLIMAILVALGILFAPQLVHFLTLFSEDRTNNQEFLLQATSLTRILFPFILLMSLGAIVSGALHQSGKFFVSAISPIALNVGYILGATLLATYLATEKPVWIDLLTADPNIAALAIGVVIGGLGQLLIQTYGAWKQISWSDFSLPSFKISPEIKKILTLMLPMTIAASAGQINAVVNSNFATSLQHGTVSWLYLAFRLFHLPLAIFGVAIGIVALPHLTRAVTNSRDQVGTELRKVLEFTLWLILPCFAFYFANSKEIIDLIFNYGKFDRDSLQATSDILTIYSFGLIGYALIKVLTSYYYAMDRTSFAMKVSLGGIFINLVVNYFLVKEFKHIGLATTTTVLVTINASILLIGVQKDTLSFGVKRFLKSLALITVATILAIGTQWALPNYFFEWTQIHKIDIAIAMTIRGIAVVIFFAAMGLIYLERTPKEAIGLLKR